MKSGFVFFIATLLFQASVFGASYLTEPSFSPDRKEIVFVSGGDIWSVSATGGAAQLLVSHAANESRPMFSPNGKQLAFVSNRTGNGDVYVLDLETSDLRRVTFDDASEFLDGWSRDGNWLYFTSNSQDVAGMNDIFRVSATGGTPTQVSADRYANEFWSTSLNDGSIIFTARGISNNQWWRHGASHIDETEIWSKAGEDYQRIAGRGAKQLWVSSTADGSKIFYVSNKNGTENLYAQAKGGQAKPLTNFADGRVLWANLSADGKEIVFERNFGLWKISADGGKPTPIPITLRGAATSPANERINLSTQIREFALSPDGKKTAMIARGEVFAASSEEDGEAFRVTNTFAAESYLAWSGDSKKLVYASERNGFTELFQYDFAAETETQLTKGFTDYSPIFSPDGKTFAFIRNGRSLMSYDAATKQEKELCKIFTDAPPLLGARSFAWSPDGKWIAFLGNSPENRSYTNAYAVPSAGGTARPLSALGNSFSGSLSWSPDGSFILFSTSQRTEDGTIARVELKLKTPKFKEDSFRDLFKQENPKERPTPPNSAPSPTPTPAPKTETEKKDEKPVTEIVFEEIRQRLSMLRPGVNVSDQIISPDGKTLIILASAEGQFNLYSLSLDELATNNSIKQLTSTATFKSNPQFSKNGADIYFLENGRINIFNLTRQQTRPLAANIETNADFANEKTEIFKQGWRYIRDNFYDEKFHGADWEAIGKTFEPYIKSARTTDEVRRLMNMMVGELNASHLGISGASGFVPTPVGKLGLRFDRAEYEANGRLKITEIIKLSPIAVTKAVNVGDYLLSVDGVKINQRTNLDELLQNKVGKRTVLGISSDGATAKEVIVKPVSTAAEKQLLYRQWVEANREYVAKASGGKLGYVHIPDMSSNSLEQLYVDLDAENQAKQGVVIDVRNNNGGFINVYLADIFSRQGYLTMKERGLWEVPARSALGQRALERPTVLVTNQHSLSDAEDFTEGYRVLKLGKVVGEPTAGWIIFTWNANLFDGTTIRLPRQLILGKDGKNMELNPRQVDLPVTRPIGESLRGKDSQLDLAVETLLRN